MFRIRFFIAASLTALCAASLCAEETPTLAEQQWAVFDQIFEICGDNCDFRALCENRDLPKMNEVIQLLRDSESLFLESDAGIFRERYLEERAFCLAITASITEDDTEKEKMFEESITFATMIKDTDDRNSILQLASDFRQYGYFDFHEIQTIDEALKIPKMEWRNRALSQVVEKLSRQEPPDFAEALRAAKLITDDDVLMRGNCFSIIAVAQMRAGLFEDSWATTELITQNRDSVFFMVSTLFTYVLIHELDNVEVVKQLIDEMFELVSQTKNVYSITDFFQYCHSCLVQMKNPDLSRYLYEKMLAMNNDFLGGHQIAQIDLTLALAAAHLGDREASEQFFINARTLIAKDEGREGYDNEYRLLLITALFDANFDAQAAKELENYITQVQKKRSFLSVNLPSNGDGRFSARVRWGTPDFSPSRWLYILAVNFLAEHGHFAEAIATIRMIPDEGERFDAYYSGIVLQVQRRLQDNEDDCVKLDSPRKRFSSAQEILDIAEMLTDEPDGKSLESYRVKIRRQAERYAKIIESSGVECQAKSNY